MKPEFHSKTLLGITRSKAKMFEFGVHPDDHIAVPKDPARLFPLALGMLGELAVATSEVALAELNGSDARRAAKFSAQFIDAYRNARFRSEHNDYYSILAGAAFYLSEVPGSAHVLIEGLDNAYPKLGCEGLDALVIWLMRISHGTFLWADAKGSFHDEIVMVTEAVGAYFAEGYDLEKLTTTLDQLRTNVYFSGTARQLLMADLACAIARMKVRHSARYCLPLASGLTVQTWAKALARKGFVRELWPAQRLLGEQGIFAGKSAVVQMPTSAGKTRSVEIIIRSAFLADRTRLAVIVAPFKALCHEIRQHLERSFAGEPVDVNEPSDVLQADFDVDFAANRRAILVATPEKLLYITRQEPELASRMGLVIYDEGHQFDSGIRGVTYELLLTSLKEAIPAEAQVILISAVIGNGEAVSKWLIGKDGQVVSGVTLSPTTRSVAFSSYLKGAGQLQFVSEENPNQEEFFVPKILTAQALAPIKKEPNASFPRRTEGMDIALSLGSRLVGGGSVAIFCGRKDAVPGLCERALEVFARGIKSMDVSQYSSADEVARLSTLYTAHYGEGSIASRAAQLGICTHHRNVPEGLRVAVEFAMRERLVAFVICTSTLAQGVNLPIRYLLVTSVYQGREPIKARDFQNLMGRVGRSGMFTEGSVIFTDPDIYGLKSTAGDGWRFQGVAKLLRADSVQPCDSSLLSVLKPVTNNKWKKVTILAKAVQLAEAYIEDKTLLAKIAANIVAAHKDKGFELPETKRQLDEKAAIFGAIESFLLANWDENENGLSEEDIGDLAKRTFAYSLASEPEKKELVELFHLLAKHVASKVGERKKRRAFGRSLYGVADSLRIEKWVQENLAALLACDSSTDLLPCVWPILRECIPNGNVRKAEPEKVLRDLAVGWIDGKVYHQLLATAVKGELIFKTPKQSRKVTLDRVIDICESGLAYDGALCVSALIEVVGLIAPDEQDLAKHLAVLQKRLRYGLSQRRMIRIFEAGFTDRVIAMKLSAALDELGAAGGVETMMQENEPAMREILKPFPSYFETVLEGIVS